MKKERTTAAMESAKESIATPFLRYKGEGTKPLPEVPRRGSTGMRPLVKGAFQSEVPEWEKSKNYNVQETGNLIFSKTIRASLKSFKDITGSRHKPNISYTYISCMTYLVVTAYTDN